MTQNRSKPVSRDSSKKSPNHYENFCVENRTLRFNLPVNEKTNLIDHLEALFSRNKKG
jgi:hypothetical protein